jgi:Protein of unknown function (DUF3592)
VDPLDCVRRLAEPADPAERIMISSSTFILFLALLFVLGIGLVLRANLIYRQSVRTRAKVIGSQVVKGTRGIHDHYNYDKEYYKVEFTDSRGKRHRVQLWETTRSPDDDTDPDGKVAILYDPRNPERVWLDSYVARYTIAFTCMAPAVLVVAFLIIIKIVLMFQS